MFFGDNAVIASTEINRKAMRNKIGGYFFSWLHPNEFRIQEVQNLSRSTAIILGLAHQDRTNFIVLSDRRLSSHEWRERRFAHMNYRSTAIFDQDVT